MNHTAAEQAGIKEETVDHIEKVITANRVNI